MKRTLSLLLAAMLLIGLLAGCGGSSTPSAAPVSQAPASQAPASESPAEENLRYDDTQYISMFTSSPGGDMYNMAAAIAPIWERELNVVASIGPGGSLSNYKAIAAGECTIGFDHQCMHYWGERAEGPFDEVVDGVSYMAILFPATVQCFSTDKNQLVQQISDVADKRVGFGAVGSALNVFLLDYLDVMYGITPDTIVANGGSVSYMSDSEMSSALADGIIDVGFALGTYPKTSLQELENNPGLRLISFGDDLDKYLETNTGWGKIEIPANTYVGQTEPYTTATSWAIMSLSKDMDEELVYRLTRITWENIEEAGEAAAAIRNFMKLENTLEPMSGATLHPGAERYYKEIGML
jgi:TRAP transporter TAXI family solute receptor